MHRRVVGTAVVVGLLAAMAFGGSAVAAKKHRHAFTATALGAAISIKGTSFQSAYKVKSSLSGNGAAIQVGSTKGTAFPLSGSDTTTGYYANGVSKTKNTFKLAKPDANGISAINGSGKCTGGTRIYKLATCSYTFTGTYNIKTTVTHVKETGTVTR